MSENHPDFLTLACCYDTDSQGAKELRQKNHVRVLTVDVTQRESIEKLLKEVEVIMKVEKLQLWAVVNNAATLVFADSIFQTEYKSVSQIMISVPFLITFPFLVTWLLIKWPSTL